MMATDDKRSGYSSSDVLEQLRKRELETGLTYSWQSNRDRVIRISRRVPDETLKRAAAQADQRNQVERD